MLGLIEQYEYGLKYRIYEVVNWLNAEGLLESGNQPDYIHPVADVDIMAPIQYPSKVMNAAVNFYTHACEGCSAEQLAQRTRERQENKAYPICSSTTRAIVGDGEDIIMPLAGMKLSMKWKWPSYSARRVSTSRQTGRTITSSATWWRWTSLTAVVARRWIWRAFRLVRRQRS